MYEYVSRNNKRKRKMCTTPLKFYTQNGAIPKGFFLFYLMNPLEQSSFVILQKYSKILGYFNR